MAVNRTKNNSRISTVKIINKTRLSQLFNCRMKNISLLVITEKQINSKNRKQKILIQNINEAT